MASRIKDNETVRADLAEVIERHEVGLDAARPDAVAVKGKVEKLRLYTIGVP